MSTGPSGGESPALELQGVVKRYGDVIAVDGVDFAVGFDRLVKCGEPIHAGHAVCRIHARTAVDFDMAEAMIEKAVRIVAA